MSATTSAAKNEYENGNTNTKHNDEQRDKYSEDYCRATVKNVIANKEAQLIASLDFMRENLLAQFRARAAVLEATVEKGIAERSGVKEEIDANVALESTVATAASSVVPHSDMIHWLIPFADYSGKVATRIANTHMPRELLFEVCNIVAAYCSEYFNPSTANSTANDPAQVAALKATMAERQKASKAKFDLICNYSKRAREDVPNTGLFYDEDLCVYLMSKTFKKSATDAYESFFSLIGGEGGEGKERQKSGQLSSSFYTDLVNFLLSNDEGDAAEDNKEEINESSSSGGLRGGSHTTRTRRGGEVRLGSIGGGPSSDMTGMLAFFYDLLNSSSASVMATTKAAEEESQERTAAAVDTGAVGIDRGGNSTRDKSKSKSKSVTFHCQVFDIMDINWCNASRKPISKGYLKFLNKGSNTTAGNNDNTAVASHGNKEKKGGGAAVAPLSSSPSSPTLSDGTMAHPSIYVFADEVAKSSAEEARKELDNEGNSSSSSPSPSLLVVQYKHIDLKEPSTVYPLIPDLQKLHFISVCWAINEAVFLPEFWRIVLTNTRQAYLLVVEGKEDKLDLLVEVCEESGVDRTYHYDRFESPRRLIIKPSSGV